MLVPQFAHAVYGLCHIWTGPTATINYSSLPLFLPLFITAAFYFTPSSAASVIEQTPSSSACVDLQCWLGSLVINIPDQRFEVMDVDSHRVDQVMITRADAVAAAQPAAEA